MEDRKNPEHLPPLYIITPTYRRPEQIAELTRLAHTLMLVPNLHWLIIEDATEKTPLVTSLLKRTGLSYDHLIGNFLRKPLIKSSAIICIVSADAGGVQEEEERAKAERCI